MKKWLSFFIFLTPMLAEAAAPNKIISGPEGRLQYITNIASTSIGDLGTQIKVVDEGTLQGGASWFNFVGAGVTASVSGGTATITVNGGGGGGGGGSSALFVVPGGISIGSITFPTSDFRFVYDGAAGGTLTWRGSTGTITSPQTFKSSNTFLTLVVHSSDVYTVGITSGTGIFISTNGFVGGSSTFTALTIARGPDLTTRGTQLVSDGSNNLLFVSNDSLVMTIAQNSLTMNQPLLGQSAGTPAADSFAFGASQSMGMYPDHFSGDRLGFATTSKPRIIIDNLGSVGTGGKYGSAGFVASTHAAANMPIVQFTSDVVKAEWTGSSNTQNTDTYFSSPTVHLSSVTISLATTTINSVTYRWTSRNPTNGQVLTADGSNNIFWQTPTGGGSPASIQSPSTGPYVLQSDAGIRYGIAATTGIEVGVGLQLTNWMSTAAAAIAGAGGNASLTVGVGSPFNLTVISSPTSAINLSTNTLSSKLLPGSTAFISLSSATRTSKLGMTWDGGGSALTTGTSYWLVVPASATLVNYRLDALPSGSISIAVSTSDIFSLSAGKSICSNACPSLSGASSSADGLLAGWAKNLNKDSYIWFTIITAATVQQANLTLEYLKPE